MMKHQIKKTRLYNLLRWMRHGFRTPLWLLNERNELAFYSPFIGRLSLCFDIGANIGEKSKVFRALGARLVCVEPVPECVIALKKRFSFDEMVTVVESAIGDRTGVADLFVGDSSTISSMLPDWIEKNPEAMKGRERRETIQIALTTLDSLIVEYGEPDFCKIDVEGFELSVLNGLSRPLKSLSFEFNLSHLDAAKQCVDRLAALSDYAYRFTFSSPLAWETTQWVDGQELIRHLRSCKLMPGNCGWGDVFAVTKASLVEGRHSN